MENEESADQQNTTDNRSSSEKDEKTPSKIDNAWEEDLFDDTNPNLRKEKKDPKGTLFY